MKMFGVLACLISLVSVAVSIQEPSHKSGPIIIVGGGTVPTEAIDKLIAKKTHGDIVVISLYEKHREKWRRNIPTSIFTLPEGLPFIPICSVGGVVIEGGDQWDYLRRIDKNWLQAIHDKGSPILGTSAGAMILGEYYFTAEKDTITSEQAKQNINVCLGHSFLNIKYLKGKIVDTHYNARDRKGRLEVFIEKSGAICGLGVDEQTALYMDDKGEELFGEGIVAVVPHEKAVTMVSK